MEPFVDNADEIFRLKPAALTLSYLTALLLIALLSVGSHIITRRIIAQSSTDAPLINLAGRQRMLSQKISKEALLLRHTTTGQDAEDVRRRLERTLADWARGHNGLQSGDAQLELAGRNTPEVQAMFAALQAPFDRLRVAVGALLSGAGSRSADMESMQKILADAENYLAAMEAIVAQYEREARRRIEALSRAGELLLVAVLLLLLLEGLLIYRPMIRRIVKLFEEAAQTNQSLRQALTQIKALKGLLPICSACKSIRDPQGDWHPMEVYIQHHSEAKFSHGICPQCAEKLYPGIVRKRSEKPEGD